MGDISRDYINIDKTIGKARNRVRRIGIELEGGWTKKLPPGTRLVHDGSVRFPQDVAIKLNGGQGELPSPPLDLTMFAGWIETYYPQIVNETCGMHIHLSFKNALTYQRLMNPKYPATILAYITKWAKDEKLVRNHPIWERLRGENEYCKHQFWADEQVKRIEKDHDRMRNGNRYTIINYSYGVHSTLECRLLPMMVDAKQATRAIQNIIDTTNAFLVVTAAREEKVKIVREVDEEILRNTRKIYV